MKLILRADVESLGRLGQIVTVKPGYGRNYLVPRGYAIRWTRGAEKQIDQIKREHVGAVFPESSVNPKLAKAIADDAGARVGAPLYADTLGPKGSKGETYIGSIEANTQAIASGLTDGKVTCKFS